MRRVDFFILEDGETEKRVGSISFDGKDFVVEPADDVRMENIFRASAIAKGSGASIDREEEPEHWFEALFWTYSGAYLWAGRPKEVDVEMSLTDKAREFLRNR